MLSVVTPPAPSERDFTMHAHRRIEIMLCVSACVNTNCAGNAHTQRRARIKGEAINFASRYIKITAHLLAARVYVCVCVCYLHWYRRTQAVIHQLSHHRRTPSPLHHSRKIIFKIILNAPRRSTAQYSCVGVSVSVCGLCVCQSGGSTRRLTDSSGNISLSSHRGDCSCDLLSPPDISPGVNVRQARKKTAH